MLVRLVSSSLALCGALVLAPLVLGEENAWKEEANSKSCVICSRVRGGSAVKEFRGVGVIDADPDVVFNVLNDAESYARFMPYVADARVLKREKNSAVLYQRLALPLISDRDYTIVSKHDRTDGSDGPVHHLRWEAANQLGPAAKAGVVRVNLCDGSWLLEPSGPNATRATYVIYTDSGGALPAFVENSGSRIAIRKIFDAVRKQVKDPKYAAAKNQEQ